MKFESQFLTEKFKNKDNVEELENVLKDLVTLKVEDMGLDSCPILNPTGENNSLDFSCKGKKINIEKENGKFNGEVNDGKNKIAISEINAKIIFDKFQELFNTSYSVIHNSSTPD